MYDEKPDQIILKRSWSLIRGHRLREGRQEVPEAVSEAIRIGEVALPKDAVFIPAKNGEVDLYIEGKDWNAAGNKAELGVLDAEGTQGELPVEEPEEETEDEQFRRELAEDAAQEAEVVEAAEAQKEENEQAKKKPPPKKKPTTRRHRAAAKKE